MYVSKKLHTELIPGPLAATSEPIGLPAIDLGGIVHYRLTVDTLIWFEHAIARYIANEPGRVARESALNDRAKLHLFADRYPGHFGPAKVDEACQHASTHGAKDLPAWKEPLPF